MGAPTRFGTAVRRSIRARSGKPARSGILFAYELFRPCGQRGGGDGDVDPLVEAAGIGVLGWRQHHIALAGGLDIDACAERGAVTVDRWRKKVTVGAAVAATGINDVGQIVGTALVGGRRRAYLLTPR